MDTRTRVMWENHEFSSGGYAGEDYLKFQRAMRADLNRQLKAEGLTLCSFNKNHYCFSAVVTDGENFAYISISDVRCAGHRLFRTLYRTMAHDKDWTGGQNNYCDWDEVARNCRILLERERESSEQCSA